MRIIRPILLLIAIVFATTALYSQGQYIWQNRSVGWGRAILMQLEIAYPVIIVSIILICSVLIVEYFYQKQENKKHNKVVSLLESIAKKLGADINGEGKEICLKEKMKLG